MLTSKYPREAAREPHFRAIFDQAAIGIMQTDMNRRIISANQYVCAMLGYTQEELLTKETLDVTHPDEHAITLQRRQHMATKDATPITVEKRYLHKDGHTVWARLAISLLRDADDQPHSYIIILEDISHQKATEDALQTTQEQYRLLFETTTVGVLYHDVQGMILAANPAAAQILGVAQEDCVGISPRDPHWRAIHPDGSDFPSDQHPVMVAAHSGQPVTGVVMGVFNPSDLTYHWLSVNAVPQFRRGAPQPYMVIMTFEDITARQEFERRTQGILDALMQMARLLVAHEPAQGAQTRARAVLTIARQVLGCVRIGLVAFHADSDTLHPITLDGTEAEGIMQGWRATKMDVRRKTYLSRTQLTRLQSGKLTCYTNTPEALRGPDATVKRALLAPVLVKGEFMGYLVLDFARPAHRYSAHEKNLATATANLLGLLLEQERLAEERATAVAAQRASEEDALNRAHQLEAIFEAMADSIFVTNRQGHLTEMNRAGQALLGMPKEDIPAHETAVDRLRTFQIRDFQGQPLTIADLPITRLLQGEALYGATALDARARLRDGSERIINISGAPILDADGAITSAVQIVRDVTEKHRQEQQTREALQALLGMAEAMAHSSTVASADTETATFLETQATAVITARLAELIQAVLGCRTIVIGTTVSPDTVPVIIPPPSTSAAQQWWDAMLRDTLGMALDAPCPACVQVQDIVVRDFAVDPFPCWADYVQRRVLCVPICRGERLVGYLGLEHLDSAHTFAEEEVALIRGTAKLAGVVQERAQLQREWEVARANELAMREAERLKDDFLNLAGHELRTPLTHFKATVQLVQRKFRHCTQGAVDGMVTMPQQDIMELDYLLEATNRQTVRMTRLIRDLVDGSHLHLDGIAIQPEPCDLVKIVREAVHIFYLARPDEQLDFDVPETLVLVRADAERIEQVLLNYLMNARKYAPEHAPIHVLLTVQDGTARVSVRDHGPGISPAEQAQVWDRFYRIQGMDVTNGSEIGLGLGLYLAKMLIETHHGQVGVDSTEGDGATFWFTLPLIPAQ